MYWNNPVKKIKSNYNDSFNNDFIPETIKLFSARKNRVYSMIIL
jgi:hypothetical protein